MSGRFPARCWECGQYGHRKAECPNLRDGTGSGGRRQELFDEQQEDPFAGFGGRPANQQQPQTFCGMSLASNPGGAEQTARQAAAFLAAGAAGLKRLQDPKSRRHLDIADIPILDKLGPRRAQGQSGSGALPGARDAPPTSTGVGLMGHHRVEKPVAGRVKGARSVHTDHPAGFGCTICHGTDHTAAGCAKPGKAGDNTYCPYHGTVSGVEQHADSKCHTSVDKCFAEVVDGDGRPMSRRDVDRSVTDFVRVNRGGRPEPRCEGIHNHWAMCVARHIRANGLDGITADVLPVRRAEVNRREGTRELSWRQFSHRDLTASCARFCDRHWECDTPEQLVEKLEAYARVGLYKLKSQRPKGPRAREDGPAERPDVDMADGENPSAAGEAESLAASPAHSVSGSEQSDNYVRSDRGGDSADESEGEVNRLADKWNSRKPGEDDLGCFPDA